MFWSHAKNKYVNDKKHNKYKKVYLSLLKRKYIDIHIVLSLILIILYWIIFFQWYRKANNWHKQWYFPVFYVSRRIALRRQVYLSLSFPSASKMPSHCPDPICSHPGLGHGATINLDKHDPKSTIQNQNPDIKNAHPKHKQNIIKAHSN